MSLNIIVTLFYPFSPLASNVYNSWIHVNKIVRELSPDIGLISCRSVFRSTSVSEIQESPKISNPLSNRVDEGTEATNDFKISRTIIR